MPDPHQSFPEICQQSLTHNGFFPLLCFPFVYSMSNESPLPEFVPVQFYIKVPFDTAFVLVVFRD